MKCIYLLRIASVNGWEVQDAENAAAYCDRADDILIYHHSIGGNWEPKSCSVAAAAVVIKYHNVTPAKFFEGISAHHQELCRLGRRQLSDDCHG
jgi:hypothetical protein